MPNQMMRRGLQTGALGSAASSVAVRNATAVAGVLPSDDNAISPRDEEKTDLPARYDRRTVSDPEVSGAFSAINGAAAASRPARERRL